MTWLPKATGLEGVGWEWNLPLGSKAPSSQKGLRPAARSLSGRGRDSWWKDGHQPVRGRAQV